MLQTFAQENFISVILFLLLAYTVAKFAIMINTKVRRNWINLFIGSMQFHNIQTIKNTFDGRMKKFMTASNMINKIIYTLAGVVVLFYVVVMSL